MGKPRIIIVGGRHSIALRRAFAALAIASVEVVEGARELDRVLTAQTITRPYYRRYEKRSRR